VTEVRDSDAKTLAAYEHAARVRPWVSLYGGDGARPRDAHELTPLDLFRAAPHDARAITYFDTTLDYSEVDRLSAIRVVPQLSKTASGKITRNVLKDAFVARNER
jgi:long-chain acyl-CoA synthetase